MCKWKTDIDVNILGWMLHCVKLNDLKIEIGWFLVQKLNIIIYWYTQANNTNENHIV